MQNTVDLLQIKIENAKKELPLETVKAIDAVDWRAPILELRTKKGYTFEQLGDLELETELLLCGLVTPQDYPKELEKRMGISRAQADELVNEMNILVFNKIQEELIKNVERKKIEGNNNDTKILNTAGIEIIPDIPATPQTQTMQTEKLELAEKPHPILAQKLSSSLQTPVVKTEHTLQNLSSSNTANTPTVNTKPKVDPYRELPE